MTPPLPRPAPRLRLLLAALAVPALAAASAPTFVGPTAPPATAAVARAASERTVSYSIDATFLPDENTIDGRETIRWRNRSDRPVEELRFHLHLNAFSNNRSTFHREAGGRFRMSYGDIDKWGSITVSSLEDGAGTDLAAAAHFDAPDDGNSDDRTVWVVPLADPVPPGGEIELRLRFASKMPKIVARTGVHRDFLAAGQWFPKLAVHEPAGQRRRPSAGWNAHQFHAWSEFYSDFGTYDVTLRYPNRYVVGATGACAATSDEGTTRTSRFVARDVHDFAFVLWPRYRVVRDRFDPAKDLPAPWLEAAAKRFGVPPAQLALSPVDITYLEVPGREDHRERQLRTIKRSLAWLGLHYGAYPHPTLTVADVPRGAEEAGGMEYPTFVTTLGLTAWNGSGTFVESAFSVETTVHEIAHQWFQGMVASNEYEEAWLDEGLTTFATAQALVAFEALEPGSAGSPGPIRLSEIGMPRLGLQFEPALDPLSRRSWEFGSGGSYAISNYPKTDLTLRFLRNRLGADRFDRAIRGYALRWRFDHPTAADLRAALEAEAGRPLDPEWRDLVETTATLDHEVARFSVRKDRAEGMFERGGNWIELPEKDEDGKPKKDDSPPTWTSTVLVRNNGTMVVPTVVRFVFRSGEKREYVERTWDGRGGWIRYRVSAKWKLDRVEVDPSFANVLDLDRANNSRQAGGAMAEVLGAAAWLLAGAGALLSSAGGLLP